MTSARQQEIGRSSSVYRAGRCNVLYVVWIGDTEVKTAKEIKADITQIGTCIKLLTLRR
jgi:hypothetical protein